MGGKGAGNKEDTEQINSFNSLEVPLPKHWKQNIHLGIGFFWYNCCLSDFAKQSLFVQNISHLHSYSAWLTSSVQVPYRLQRKNYA